MVFPRLEKYTLQCEWGQCRDMLEVMDDFYIHLDQHFWHYVSMLPVEEEATYICQWCDCDFATTNSHDLVRHLYFHGFHTKVKWLGYLKHCQSESGPCHSHQNRNIIPELPDGFKCCWENCFIVSDIPDKFYEHVTDHVIMSDPEILSNGKPGFKCHWEGCSYEYATDKGMPHTGRHKLKGHMTTHTQERCYACPWCGNLYVNKTKLIDHFTRQIGVEGHNFQCTHCSRTFASERILKDHMRHHVNHYQCPKCAMTCPNPSALKHHIRYKHSSERPYACDFCDYRSKESHDMEKHMDLHERDCTYPCQVAGCDYEVRSLQNLHSHYRVKHGSGNGKYYSCHLCEKMYSTGNQLTHHLRKIHNFQWPPGHCRFRYKECEDGLYRLQIFRYESIEISKQISLDDIGVPVDVEQGPENIPSTSMIMQPPDTTAMTSVFPKKMNAKRKRPSAKESNDTGVKKVPKRSKRIAAYRTSSRQPTNTVPLAICGTDVNNGAGMEELPVLFYQTSDQPNDSLQHSGSVQEELPASASLHSWLTTENVSNVETTVVSSSVDPGTNSMVDISHSMPLQEISNAKEPFNVESAGFPLSLSDPSVSTRTENETVVTYSEESLSRFLDDAWNNLPSNVRHHESYKAPESCDVYVTNQALAEESQTARYDEYNILDRLLEGEPTKSSTVAAPSRSSLPNESSFKVKKNLSLDNEFADGQSTYSQWVKQCSVPLVSTDSPVFPNHHKLTTPQTPNDSQIKMHTVDGVGVAELSRNCNASLGADSSSQETSVPPRVEDPQLQHSGHDEFVDNASPEASVQLQVEDSRVKVSGYSELMDISSPKNSVPPLADDLPVEQIGQSGLIANTSSQETTGSPNPTRAVSKLTDAYLEQHPTLININGKQVRLSHADVESPVDVRGVKHFLVSGKDEESGGSVYCLVAASILEEN